MQRYQDIMPNGLVKFFSAAKGFGFITADEGGKDIFVPASSVTASGLASLKPGQRVSFEAQPDAKGPKAISLKVIADAPPPPAPVVRHAPVAHVQAPAKLTIYLDPNCDKAQTALDDLRAAGESPNIVNYIAAPPSRDQLKNLSMLLRDAGQNLVRKYDPLFQELRLDDRFISDAEFWGGIFENPSLINGPVLEGGGRAAICRTENAVEAFLALLSGKAVQQPAKPKALPAPVAVVQVATPKVEPISAPVEASANRAVDECPAKPKAALKPKPQPKAGKKPIPAPKKNIKAKATAKPPLKKAVKKTVRKVAKKKAKPRSR
jgi:arsenate reductase (glutaredoxin)